MTPSTHPASRSGRDSAFGAWLTQLSDADLVMLLRNRPDLAVPPPLNMNVLTDRVCLRASVQRALDDADLLTLTVVEALALLGAAEQRVNRAALLGMFAGLHGAELTREIDARIDWLRERALIWGDDLQLIDGAADAVPWRIGRLSTLQHVAALDGLPKRLQTLPPEQAVIVEKLAHGTPFGSTRDAAPDAHPERPIPQLIAAGLLARIDDHTVELPFHVGQVVRGEAALDPHVLTEPTTDLKTGDMRAANASAAGEAMEFLRDCTSIIAVLGTAPAPDLKAGGLGVRELRRIAKSAGLSEERTGLLVEVLAAATLITKGDDYLASGDPVWAPSEIADAWLDADTAAQWAKVASAWLSMKSRPWLIGWRGATDKPAAALSEDIVSHTAEADRRHMLSIWTAVPEGTVLQADDAQRLLTWRRPRAARRFAGQAVISTLAEASALGLVVGGILTAPGRALLTDPDLPELADIMQPLLPQPLDHVLVQADLTVVAPGPLVPELHDQVNLVADVESAGAATVYRVTEHSVLRALDSGMSATAIHTLFDKHSRTPVPQALKYLVDDTARRHGQLRAGMASSFIRCEDPAMMKEVLASAAAAELGLRALAPTVAVSQLPLGDVLERLRSAGFTPAGEDESGDIIDLRPRGVRLQARRQRSVAVPRTLPVPKHEQLVSVVEGLRATQIRTSHSRASASGSTAATVALLQLAVQAQRRVLISFVDAQGTAGVRVVEPVAVQAGQLHAFDPTADAVRRFSLARMSSVELLDN
ncbi:helicase C-terminal domain-containing protein [Hoyosella sp. YIM 151337]|uniref:helicase C-terminal domain-containing protein n=1 Tax=Hoyosella sp. YIM 151337 TaxID=2992742 RepID=UPI002235CFCF|nr:helicase C-terminal domain-containing protein [Hoyosella sp. YIM 151337]MCW4356032.1 helicase C-terminal domain-containing protein [Hoyosella sp. YIM 151337]